jgi:hypothetical protein
MPTLVGRLGRFVLFQTLALRCLDHQPLGAPQSQYRKWWRRCRNLITCCSFTKPNVWQQSGDGFGESGLKRKCRPSICAWYSYNSWHKAVVWLLLRGQNFMAPVCGQSATNVRAQNAGLDSRKFAVSQSTAHEIARRRLQWKQRVCNPAPLSVSEVSDDLKIRMHDAWYM